MTSGKPIAVFGYGAAAIGFAVAALPLSSTNAQQPPREGCTAVTKSEYTSAKREKLLRNRYGAYVRTGRVLHRFYWYCR